MFRFCAIAGLSLLSGTAQSAEALCDLEGLYDLVKLKAVSIAGLPDTAVFPALEDVNVQQTGVSCIFDMSFSFTVENLDGDITRLWVDAEAYRLFSVSDGELQKPDIRIKYTKQE